MWTYDMIKAMLVFFLDLGTILGCIGMIKDKHDQYELDRIMYALRSERSTNGQKSIN